MRTWGCVLLLLEWKILQHETQKSLSCAQEIGENWTDSCGGRSGLSDWSSFPFPLSSSRDLEVFSYWLLDLLISIIVCADRFMTTTIQGILPGKYICSFNLCILHLIHLALCQVFPDAEKKSGVVTWSAQTSAVLYPIQDSLLLHHFPLVRRAVDPKHIWVLPSEAVGEGYFWLCCLQPVLLTIMAESSVWRWRNLEIASGYVS